MRISMIFLVALAAAACSSKKSSSSTEQEAKCRQDCEATRATGTPLYESFVGCLQTTCKQFEGDEEKLGNCMNSAFDPGNGAAACKAQTGACFSGPIPGCKQLMEFAEEKCEPAQLPITDEMAGFEMIWCLISSGWLATPAVQAKAWPLYQCVMLDPPEGCLDECAKGRGPCRACAQVKCADLYTACLNDSATWNGDATIPADRQACQDIHTCVNFCLP